VEYRKLQEKFPQKSILPLLNKWDACAGKQRSLLMSSFTEAIAISAKNQTGLNELKQHLLELVHKGKLFSGDTIVTNARHYDSLVNALAAITEVRIGLAQQLSGDLLAIDLRDALNYLGEITGQVSNDELLGNIFSNFCIGK
ncbi:MAG: tRNA uridine-5-carboxymethylaminomethyl(34) synthesis GTPase MnmE, partial [Flavobacteriaceae bacterium]|nr:tRNA uridine-5-carboxymethylaminomethyl(34) synthesis GTPase MnmE [Flavobacteriaceae bacterium]